MLCLMVLHGFVGSLWLSSCRFFLVEVQRSGVGNEVHVIRADLVSSHIIRRGVRSNVNLAQDIKEIDLVEFAGGRSGVE